MDRIFLWIFRRLWVVVLVVLVWFFARATKPSGWSGGGTVHDTAIISLAEYTKDSLTNEIKNRALRIFGLEGMINKLLLKLKEVKPETIIVVKEANKWTLKWEWIAHVERKKDRVIVVTFKIDSVLTEQDSATIAALIEAGKRAEIDSVWGRVKRYDFAVKEKEFVLTSKKDGLFLKSKRESPFSSFLMLGFGWTAFDTAFGGFDEPLNLKRFSVHVKYDFWINRLRLTPFVDTKKGGTVGVDADFMVFGAGRMKYE